MSKIGLALGFSSVLLLVGCGTSAPIVDASYTVAQAQASHIRVQSAIYTALKRRGWRLQSDNGEQIRASYNKQNRHIVNIKIDYTANRYQIEHVSSQGMKYNPKKNTIHRNYNRWIANLERDINADLSFQQ